DADSIDHDELGDTRRRAHCDLSSEPAAERIAEHDRLFKLERIHQIEIKVDEVLETIEVGGDRRAGKARMDWFDQIEAFGETIGERITKNRATASVQDQHARALALAAYFEIDPLLLVDGRRRFGHRVLLAPAGGQSPSRYRRSQFYRRPAPFVSYRTR